MKVKIFFRKNTKSKFSIEQLFKVVIDYLPKDIIVDSTELRYEKASIIGVLKNILYARKQKGLLNHITGDVHYAILGSGRNTILTIHDVKSCMDGGFVKKYLKYIFWLLIPALYARRITTVSPFSKSEIVKIIPFVANKLSVLPNPYNPSLLNYKFPVSKGEVFSILHVGTKLNKNLKNVIKSIANIECELRIVGKLSDAQLTQLKEAKVTYKNYCDLTEEDIARLYRESDLLCFPSTYEGFGLPIIEAQLLSLPVVTSNLEPMKWVAGNGASFVDPFSVDSIREAILKIKSDEDYRAKLVEFGTKNVKRFDPSTIAAMYADLYRSLA